MFKGASNRHGPARHTIYDPVRHKYFSLDDDRVALLSIWHSVSSERLSAEAGALVGHEITPEDIADTIYFLHVNNLTEDSARNDPRDFASQAEMAKQSWLRRAIHSYLFVRIPLVRPYAFLSRTLFLVEPLMSRAAWYAIGLLGALGIYLVTRQWHAFQATFLEFFTLDGLFAYGTAIVLIKVLHELGHAYMATRLGVRVGSMGVAFMVMMPLLYTDVTNAWRLQSARQRLQIDMAGIIVELGLACVATCLWAFLPDGSARSVAFVTATTSWVLSLAINLNPFMKFDGYYILVDFVGIPNLQDRAFALAKWRLREVLFGIGFSAPEQFKDRTMRCLVVYAWCVWIYRLFLFLGIALLVYELFFKLLGVVLFAIEVVWFIAIPVVRELLHWWKIRSHIMTRPRSLVSAAIVLCLLLLLFVPMRWPLALPAVLSAEVDVAVHAPHNAQVITWSIQPGAKVGVEHVLARLSSPALVNSLHKNDLTLSLLDLRLARIAGDRDELTTRMTLIQERAARLEERAGLRREAEKLVIRAPISGTLRDVNHALHTGAWVNPGKMLARIVSNKDASVRAYANEEILWSMATGDQGTFVPDDIQMPTTTVTLDDIAQAGSDALSIPYLSSVHGGAVASERQPDGRVVPRKSQYVLRLGSNVPAPESVVRGVVRLPGRKQSIANMVWRRVAQVLIRETGF